MEKALVQVVGFGPAALGLLVAADRNNYLTELLSEGIVFLDRRAKDEWDNLFYHIRSNSSASDFLCKIRSDGEFGALLNSNLAKVIKGYGDNTMPLTMASNFMKTLAAEADNIISRSSRSAVLYKSDVAALMLGNDGVTSISATGEKLVKSRYAVIAIGAEEGGDAGRNCVGDDVVFNSGDIIAGKQKATLEKLIREGRKVVITGGSHSAFSTVVWLLKLFGEWIDVGQIELIYKNEFKLYYKSIEAAASCGIDMDSQNVFHPTGEVNKFNGLRGVAREFYLEIANHRENRVRLRELKELANEENAAGRVIINAVGYSPRNIELCDERGEKIQLLTKHRNVCLTNSCNVVSEDGTVFESIFAMGLGHALEYNGEPKVGINYFHGEVADAILNKMGAG